MVKGKAVVRGTKGLQTRERLLGAAVAEFARDGIVAADIRAIVAAAGVSHGTFFFHFPTKEHVLIELEKREEERMAAELAKVFATIHDLRSALTEIVRVLQELETRLGNRLFKDFLALHFSTTRPPSEESTDHPVIVAVVEEFRRTQKRGDIPADVDVFHNGVSFLVGLYALLITIPEVDEIRTPVIKEYLTTYMYGLRALSRHEPSQGASRVNPQR